MAQLVARLVRIEEVRGSNPLRSTEELKPQAIAWGFNRLRRDPRYATESARRPCTARSRSASESSPWTALPAVTPDAAELTTIAMS